ncbi:MAG: hypothetical protein CL799_09620, partial [Chromatiales bacterium]|nr:hypothetical protein [Chromatiales bacterium]
KSPFPFPNSVGRFFFSLGECVNMSTNVDAFAGLLHMGGEGAVINENDIAGGDFQMRGVGYGSSPR